MPYNPNEPQNGEIVDADLLRAQFNALKTLDDAKLPAAEKAAANGVASLDANSRLVQPADWSSLANKPVPVPRHLRQGHRLFGMGLHELLGAGHRSRLVAASGDHAAAGIVGKVLREDVQ